MTSDKASFVFAFIIDSSWQRKMKLKKIKGSMVNLLPLPPNCKPWLIFFQIYLICLSLNFKN